MHIIWIPTPKHLLLFNRRHLSMLVCMSILRPWWQYFWSHVFNDYKTLGYILIISVYMSICFCTCEYVQFVGSRQNKKCVLWYKLEGCIYIDWRICVFNVHLPLELSFFLWSIPFYTQTFWTERFEISFDICRPCVWYEWLRVCVLYARPFVDLILSYFFLSDMVSESTSVTRYYLRKSPN